jgi:hypothetical protein
MNYVCAFLTCEGDSEATSCHANKGVQAVACKRITGLLNRVRE